MNRYDTIVAGAGFAGIYTAWRLAKAGQSVALVEASPRIGGNLQSIEWNGFWLDNGTHNFDIRRPLGEDFYRDILRDNILIFEDQKWACTTDRTWIYGFEAPDFSEDNPELTKAILSDLHRLQDTDLGPEPEGYYDWYARTYGGVLASALEKMMRKYTGSDPREISSDAKGLLGTFARVKLGSDAEMIALKETSQFWDDRVSVTLDCGDDRFIGDHVNKRYCYPAQKGLTGFCDAAFARLQEMGVDIMVSSPVAQIVDQGATVSVTAGDHQLEAKTIFWSLPDVFLAKVLNLEVDFSNSAVPVGTCFFAYEVPADSIVGPDYLQDYSPDRLPFRYNKQGVYSNQIKSDGATLVVTEVPCSSADISKVATEENNAEAWRSLLDVGFLKPGTEHTASKYWGHPVAYTLPKIGWRVSYEAALAQIADVSNRIVGIEFGYRGRKSFMSFYEDKLQSRLLG